MSVLFSSVNLGSLEVRNRFVHSATYESMATETGEVTDDLVKRYRTLARGEIGLIIPGYFFVHPSGRAAKHQIGIHRDAMIPGLRRVADAVHQGGGKIAFQLAHGGAQTKKAFVGRTPLAPSKEVRDPATLRKPKEMTGDEIQGVIKAFVKAAGRAAEAGADAVQFHGAHGYLISEFLSPFYNRRHEGPCGLRVVQQMFCRCLQQPAPAMLPCRVACILSRQHGQPHSDENAAS